MVPIDLTRSPPVVDRAIPVGTSPLWIAITPDGATALVTDFQSGAVTPIALPTDTALPAVAVGGAPYAIAITPDGRTAYVTDGNGNTVTPIDLSASPPARGAAVTVGNLPRGIAISPHGA